jgi:TPR repeat protein
MLCAFLAISGCKMSESETVLPPHLQYLPPFNPHVASFTCQIEASKVPPIDAQANDWFLEARALEDPLVYDDDIDYKKVVRLTRQAAERHHWKAMLNLASLYIEGHDHPNGKAEAVALVNQAIDLGIPAAYDRMCTYQINGIATYSGSGDAYALFQRAAEMGHPHSMTYLGEKMDAGADGLKAGYWGNIPVAIKMFECALAQGHGPGADELEYIYSVPRLPNGSEQGKARQRMKV